MAANRPGMQPSAIADACALHQSELDPLLESVRGEFDPESRTLTVFVEAAEDEEVHERLLEIYFDFTFYLPMGPPEVQGYRMELATTSEEGETGHLYVLESDVSLLPDTGGATREQWTAFASQFLCTLDGAPHNIPMPDDFPDD